MKNTKLLIVVIIILAIAGVVFYGLKLQKQSSQTSLKIGLNPWIGNGLFYVAKEKGFFDKEGVNVELQSFDDSAVGRQLLNTNKIDMLPFTAETAVILADAGVPIKVVGMSDSSQGADGIIATNNIKKLSDLKGKRVAFEVGSPSHFFISYLLDREGLSTQDLTVVNLIAPDAGAAFVAGQVDAAVTWQPWLSKATDRPGGHLLIDSKALSIFPDFVIFRDDYAKNSPQEVKAMMRAMFATREWILANQSEANEIIAKSFNISTQEVQEQLPDFKWLSYQENVDSFNQKQPQDLLQKAANLWLKLGLIKKSINMNDMIDDSFIVNLYK